MIVHIALYRWKNGTTEERVNNILMRIKQLKEKCDGIIDILCGKNYHKESKGFTHGIVVLAKNQQALDGYRFHPDHLIIAKDVEGMEEDGLGFDFKSDLQQA